MTLHSATSHDGSDTNIILSSGQFISNFHKAGECLGEHCPVHKPSGHKYRDAPLSFNGTHMVRLLDSGNLPETDRENPDKHVVIDPDDYLYNRTGQAILRNAAQCLKCDTVVTSESRHDFRQCKCGNVFVDGGFTYIRHGVKESDFYVNESLTFFKE